VTSFVKNVTTGSGTRAAVPLVQRLRRPAQPRQGDGDGQAPRKSTG
jgi:hypothetical protein